MPEESHSEMVEGQDTTIPETQVPNLEEIINLVQALPVCGKVELVQRLLDKNSSCLLGLENIRLSGQITIPVQTTNKKELSDVLEVIAILVHTESM